MAALGTAAFFAVAPGVMAGVIPWALTGWEARADWPVARVVGVALTLAGAAFLVHAFARFVWEGRGTPAPVAPTERLVIGGLYRYVRNPMYVALLAAIVGQALLLGRWVLLGYAAGVFVVVYVFVRLYEEPKLAGTYGEQYAQYRRAVPGWLPFVRR